jgi:hypothetical protein
MRVRASFISSTLVRKSLPCGVVDVRVVVEIDDEDFVVGIGVLHQRQGRGFHAGALGPHAAAVVDNQSHGHRDILPLEEQDVLLDVVLRHREGVLFEVGDQLACFVHDRGVAHHQAGVGCEDRYGTLRAGGFGLLAVESRDPYREQRRREAPGFATTSLLLLSS